MFQKLQFVLTVSLFFFLLPSPLYILFHVSLYAVEGVPFSVVLLIYKSKNKAINILIFDGRFR